MSEEKKVLEEQLSSVTSELEEFAEADGADTAQDELEALTSQVTGWGLDEDAGW